jgi:O-antigen/teichoic acid export membrane protein
LGGALGYAYQILVGRIFLPQDFAIFSAVMALYAFLSSPFFALFMVVSRRVTFLAAKSQIQKLKQFYWTLVYRIVLAGVILVLFGLFFTSNAQEYLKSSTPDPIWIFYIFVASSMLLMVNNAFLQGMQNFYFLALITLFGMTIKIVLSWYLIELGYSVSGALGGSLLSSLVAIAAGIYFINRHLLAYDSTAQSTEIPPSPPKLYVLPVLIANLGFVAMTQLDMVLVNWYFSSAEASTYAAASVLGKAILYLPGGILLALFPMVAKNHSDNISSMRLIRNAVISTLLICGAITLIYWLMSDWLITLFYGDRYLGSGQILRWYGLAILPMALAMVAEHFLIAQGRTLFCWLYLLILPFHLLII